MLYIWGKKKSFVGVVYAVCAGRGIGCRVRGWGGVVVVGDIKLLECMCYVRGCRRLVYWRNAGCVVLRRGTGRPAVADANVDNSRTFGELSLQRSPVLHEFSLHAHPRRISPALGETALVS